jgi:hypothetical protein
MADEIKKALLASIEKSKEDVKKQVETIAQNFFEDVIQGSPVQKGDLVANWNAATNAFDVSINQITTNQFAKVNEAGAKGAAIAKMKASISWKDIKGDGDYFSLTNATPYAYRAEMLGWAGTPAYGMVSKALVRLGSQK